MRIVLWKTFERGVMKEGDFLLVGRTLIPINEAQARELSQSLTAFLKVAKRKRVAAQLRRSR